MNNKIIVLTLLTFALYGCGNKAINKLDTTKLNNDTQAVVPYFEKIQGKWQSNDDKTNFLVFEKDHRKEIAEGMEKWDDEVFILGDKCFNDLDKDRDLAVGKNRFITCKASDLCWYIDEVTPSTLILQYIGSGNMLSFTKAQ